MEKSTPIEFTLAHPTALLPALALDRMVTTELVSDFSLPDYLPEIKRLLRVSASVLPESRYLGGSNAEFGGAVEYAVLYAGGDGGLWVARQRQDYNIAVPVDADWMAGGMEPVADTQADSVVSRVTAPRKLNIRTRLRTRVRGWMEEDISPQLEGSPREESLERLEKVRRSLYTIRAVSEAIDLSDESTLDAAGEMRIVSVDGCVNLGEVSAGEETVNCRGELILRMLLCEAEDGAVPEQRTRRIAIDETITAPGVMSGMHCRAWGRCGDFAVNIEEGKITCDATVWIEAEAAGERELALTADLYATDGETTDCTYRDVELCRLLRCANGNFTLSGSVSVKEAGIDPEAEVIDVSGSALIDSMEWDHGRTILTGSARFNVVHTLGGEYGTSDVVLPLRYEVEGGNDDQLPPNEREVELGVSGARARIEGNGDTRRLAIDAEVTAALRLGMRERRQVLAHGVYRPVEPAQTAQCIVCYPEPEDSLWSLAKRYRVSRAALERENALKFTPDCDLPNSLDGVQYLLI